MTFLKSYNSLSNLDIIVLDKIFYKIYLCHCSYEISVSTGTKFFEREIHIPINLLVKFWKRLNYRYIIINCILALYASEHWALKVDESFMAKVKKRNRKKKSFISPFNDYWSRENYIFLAIGIVLLIIGYTLMGQGEWYEAISLTVSTIVLLIAYLVIFPLAIFYKKRLNK